MENNPIENLLFLFLIAHPVSNPKRIYKGWYKHPTLKEYKRPNIKNIIVTDEKTFGVAGISIKIKNV